MVSECTLSFFPCYIPFKIYSSIPYFVFHHIKKETFLLSLLQTTRHFQNKEHVSLLLAVPWLSQNRKNNYIYRKYLLANRIFMLLLPIVYFLFLWGPGTWGGIYLDYSQYPLGYLCLPSDQASIWASLRFILTVVKDVFFHPSSSPCPSHSPFSYIYIVFLAFSVPSPLLGQTLYQGFDWTVFLNKCGYGILLIAIYSICWLVIFLPSKHSSGKAAFLGLCI